MKTRLSRLLNFLLMCLIIGNICALNQKFLELNNEEEKNTFSYNDIKVNWTVEDANESDIAGANKDSLTQNVNCKKILYNWCKLTCTFERNQELVYCKEDDANDNDKSHNKGKCCCSKNSKSNDCAQILF